MQEDVYTDGIQSCLGIQEKCLKESFDILYRDSKQNGRLLVLHLYPWVIGQPFRIGFLDDALGHMMRHQGVWAACGTQIVEWYRGHRPAQ